MIRILLAALISFAAGAAQAKDDTHPPTVGQLFFTDRATAKPYDEAFRAGLRSLGYVEGRNITIFARYANGKHEQAMFFLRELIALPVDVLLVSPSVVGRAKEATSKLPIVCANMLDAVENGLVASLARPGGNLTGLTYQGVQSTTKRLELARDLVPGLKRVAVLFDPTFQPQGYAERIRTAAGAARMTATLFEARNLEETQNAVAAIERLGPQALILNGSPIFTMHLRLIMDRLGQRLPIIASDAEYARAGAVAASSENTFEMYRRSATYVDRILKGIPPADLPVEQPAEFDFILNLKTTKALRMTVPESVMVRATEVIR